MVPCPTRPKDAIFRLPKSTTQIPREQKKIMGRLTLSATAAVTNVKAKNSPVQTSSF